MISSSASRRPPIVRPLLYSAALLPLLTAAGLAQEPLRIGLAAPLSGLQEILGRQIVDGAAAAIAAAGRDRETQIVEADTRCTADGGRDAAQRLIEEQVAAVVGFVCTAAIEAALPKLSAAGIPVVDVGVRANRLTDRRDRTGHLIWRIAPRSDAEADALAEFVRQAWRSEPFGIVEDGSVYARDLADEVRARLSPDAIEPSLIDNFRPAEDRQFALARRIEQSGVTHILLLGARSDIEIIARDAAELDLDLQIVGGESLLDEGSDIASLPEGTRAVAVPEAAAEAPAQELPPPTEPIREGYFDPSYAATEIVLNALSQAGAEGGDLAQILNEQSFQTVLGEIRFDGKGDAMRQAFGVLEWRDGAFRPVPAL